MIWTCSGSREKKGVLITTNKTGVVGEVISSLMYVTLLYPNTFCFDKVVKHGLHTVVNV